MAKDTPLPPADREWVTVVEAARMTGYHRDHVQELARIGKVEAQLTTAGYLIYLPSLLEYRETVGRGPRKPSKRNDEVSEDDSDF